MNFKIIVFELDGTLANTAESVPGRLTPYLVLSQSPPNARTSPLAISKRRCQLPGRLIAKGYKVVIVTSGSAAYASTTCGLLRLDYHRLFAGDRSGIEQKLLTFAATWDICPEDILYVGHPHGNRGSVNAAECGFLPEQDIEKLFHFPSLGGLPPRPHTPIVFTPQTLEERRRANRPHSLVGTEGVRCPQCGRNNQIVPLSNRDGVCRYCSFNFWPPPLLQHLIIESCQRGNALSEQEIESLEGNLTSPKSPALALIALHAVPGQFMRNRIQAVALTHFKPQHRNCLLALHLDEGRFGFPPWLLTQVEVQKSKTLRNLGLSAAASLFPSLIGPRSDSNTLVRSLVSFQNGRYGDPIMRKIKDWAGMTSGPKTFHSIGCFLSLALAGNIEALFKDQEYNIVSLPSGPCSPQRPGQFSLRLGHEVAHLLDKEILDALNYGGGGSRITCRQEGKGMPAIIIDDQYTWGDSMDTAAACLKASGFDVRGAFTWSRSVLPEKKHSQHCFFRKYLGNGIAKYPCKC